MPLLHGVDVPNDIYEKFAKHFLPPFSYDKAAVERELAYCHRMIHREKNPLPSLDDIKATKKEGKMKQEWETKKKIEEEKTKIIAKRKDRNRGICGPLDLKMVKYLHEIGMDDAICEFMKGAHTKKIMKSRAEYMKEYRAKKKNPKDLPDGQKKYQDVSGPSHIGGRD